MGWFSKFWRSLSCAHTYGDGVHTPPIMREIAADPHSYGMGGTAGPGKMATVSVTLPSLRDVHTEFSKAIRDRQWWLAQSAHAKLTQIVENYERGRQ